MLQAELLESQAKFPSPPPGLNLNPEPTAAPEQANNIPAPEQQAQLQPQTTAAAPEPLAAIAQAVMTPPAPMGDRPQPQQEVPNDQNDQEDIDRQVSMQVDGLA